MPKFAVRSRPVAVSAATAMVAGMVAVLLVNSPAAPPAGAAVAPGSTVQASLVDPNGQLERHDVNSSVISGDGRTIAFASGGQLDPSIDGRGFNNIYVRDLVNNRTVMISRGQFTRVIPPPPTTTTTTTTTTEVIKLRGEHLLDLGAPVRAAAQPGVIIQPGDVSPNGSSYDPTISADGRYVAFVTFADNIVQEDEGGGSSNDTYVVVCDRDPDGNGRFDERKADGTRSTCFATNETSSTIEASQPKLSADAGRILWREEHFSEPNFYLLKTVVLPRTASGARGKPDLDTIEQVPTRPVATQSGTASGSIAPDVFEPGKDAAVLSGDGNHVVTSVELSFNCECPVVRAIISVDLSRKNEITRVDLDGRFNAPIGSDVTAEVRNPTVNADGTVIGFQAEQLIEDPFNGGGDSPPFFISNQDPIVYVVNVDYTKAVQDRVFRATVVSRNDKSQIVRGAQPALSTDGRYLAFVTDAKNMHDGVDRPTIDHSCLNPQFDLTASKPLVFNAAVPTPADIARTFCQIVVRDLAVDQDRLAQGITRLPGTLISPGTRRDCVEALPPDASCAGESDSFAPSVTADGGKVGFESSANDLVRGDTHDPEDVFVRTLEPALRGNALDFGPVGLGNTSTRTVQLFQIGNGPLPVDQVVLGGTNAADFTILGQTCQGVTLHETGTCAVTLEFSPGAAGDRRGQLTVRARGNTFTVDLLGSGTEKPPPPRAPEFSVDGSPVEFGQRLLLSSADATVTVTNRGEQALTVSAVSVIGPATPGDFTIAGNTCAGASIAANASCRVTVRFIPQAPGDRSATLQFTDNAAGGPHLVGLHGQAGKATLEVNPGVTQPERVVTVLGKGFPPNKKVNITFAAQVGGATATTGSDGSFQVPLLIFKKAKPEQRTVVATVDGFPSITATAPLLIVFPTVSPADFVVRG